ncbi:MAG: hypothetical protein ACREXY_01790 [Gammaproteobacteria bacterium]
MDLGIVNHASLGPESGEIGEFRATARQGWPVTPDEHTQTMDGVFDGAFQGGICAAVVAACARASSSP